RRCRATCVASSSRRSCSTRSWTTAGSSRSVRAATSRCRRRRSRTWRTSCGTARTRRRSWVSRRARRTRSTTAEARRAGASTSAWGRGSGDASVALRALVHGRDGVVAGYRAAVLAQDADAVRDRGAGDPPPADDALDPGAGGRAAAGADDGDPLLDDAHAPPMPCPYAAARGVTPEPDPSGWPAGSGLAAQARDLVERDAGRDG